MTRRRASRRQAFVWAAGFAIALVFSGCAAYPSERVASPSPPATVTPVPGGPTGGDQRLRTGTKLAGLAATNDPRALRTLESAPVEAVSGSADVGAVTVVHADGTREARTITLGLTDGLRVEVRAGLTDSDKILEFPADTVAAGAAGQTP